MRSEMLLKRAPYVEKTFNIMRKELRGLVLDVGSAEGIISHVHRNVVGIDILEKQYVDSYKLGDKRFLIPLVKGNMHYLPFKNNTFDSAMINHTLEHTSVPLHVLKEINRVLKKNGKLIIGVPNSTSFQSLMLKKLIGTDFYAYAKEHKSFFDIIALITLINKAGFRLEKNYRTAFHFHIFGKILEFPILRKIAQKFADRYQKVSQDIILIGLKTNS